MVSHKGTSAPVRGAVFRGFEVNSMGLFLSTTINKIDSKGRVSIPGPFRAALAEQISTGVILMKSPLHAALEGFAPRAMDEIATRLDQLPMFSTDQDDLAAATMAEATLISVDSEGRVSIPAELLRHAGIKAEIAFVGMGHKFQLWEPKAWSKRQGDANKAMRSKGLNLPKAPS